MEKNYQNIHYLFIGILALIFAGFYKTYFGLFPHFEDLKGIYHFHALMLLSWIAMLIIQPILIREKQIKWHHFLGKLSYLIVPLMLFSIALVVQQQQVKAKNLMNMSFTLSDVSFFILMYALAIWNKKETPKHIRYMIVTVLPFINPAVGRLDSSFPASLIGLSIIIILLVIEYFHQKQYKALVVSLVAYLAIYLFFMTLGDTGLDAIWKVFFK